MERIVEVSFFEWALIQQKIGRIGAARDYILHVLNAGEYFGRDDARVLLMLIGDINETDAKINEAEKEEESE